MDEVRILEIKQSVFANNDQRAELLRRELKEKRIFLLNLMSSPGSGKTTTLTRTIERLRDEFQDRCDGGGHRLRCGRAYHCGDGR